MQIVTITLTDPQVALLTRELTELPRTAILTVDDLVHWFIRQDMLMVRAKQVAADRKKIIDTYLALTPANQIKVADFIKTL